MTGFMGQIANDHPVSSHHDEDHHEKEKRRRKEHHDEQEHAKAMREPKKQPIAICHTESFKNFTKRQKKQLKLQSVMYGIDVLEAEMFTAEKDENGKTITSLRELKDKFILQ